MQKEMNDKGTMMSLIIQFIKKNIVLVIVIFAVVVTSIIVPPDSEYLNYFDFKIRIMNKIFNI